MLLVDGHMSECIAYSRNDFRFYKMGYLIYSLVLIAVLEISDSVLVGKQKAVVRINLLRINNSYISYV